MVFETWLEYDLQKPLKPQYVDGAMFTQDNMANKIGVILTNSGEPVGISGAVSGKAIRADGVTVPVNGDSNMNRAWIELPQEAYAVPGQIVVVIKLTDGETVTTIGACVATVWKSVTNAVVDPGTIISDIDTLIARINEAIDSIPADLTNLLASIAPTFDSNTAYSIGDYVWHATSVDTPASLYKFTANHAAGNWDGSQVVAAVLSQDIKNIQHIYTPVSGKPTGNLAPGFGDTVTISQASQDANGQVAFTDRTLTIPNSAATTSKAGLMSAADKSKLNSIVADYYAVCNTAAGTQTKSVTVSGGPNAYADGMTITVRFAYGQEYNGQPKLDVNLLGAKNIGISSYTAAGKGEWADGDILTFVYYEASNAFVIVNGQHGTGSTYGKTLIDESVDGSTDVVKALSSRVFYDDYIEDVIVGAGVYDPTNTYAVGAIIRKGGRVYRCKSAITTPETWNAAHWELIPAIQSQIETLRNGENAQMRNIITSADPYDPTRTYAVGDYTIQYDTLYRCIDAISTPEAWNGTHWDSQDPIVWIAQEAKDKAYSIAVGARNLLLNSANPTVTSAGGATFTTQRGVSVSEWGATDAVRVAGTGGTNHIVFSVGGTASQMAYGKAIGENGQSYTMSVYIKNNHATNTCRVKIGLPYPQGYTSIAPGESKHVVNVAVGNGELSMPIYFSSGTTAGGAFDITFWHPMIEIGTLATDWVPAPEDYYFTKSELFKDICNGSLFPSTATGELTKTGKIVTFAFTGVTIAALYANAQDTIATLPAAYVPVNDVSFVVFVQSGGITSTVAEKAVATTNGTIDIYTANAASIGAIVSGSATWRVA